MYIIIKNWIANIIFLLVKLRLYKVGGSNRFRVLVYHNIGEKEIGDYLGIQVSLQKFEEEMKFLSENAYRVFPLKELISMAKNKEPIPDKSIAITFDDGYRENLINILEIMKRYSFSATFFITIGYVEGWAKSGNKYWEKLEFCSWSDLMDMPYAGNEIGSHFLSHKCLTSLSNDELINEVAESRRILEAKLNISADIFSYPHGKFDKRIKFTLQDKGCIAACTSIPGSNSYATDMYALRRISIDARDGIFEFKKKVIGCYDWVGVFVKKRYYAGN